MPTSTIVICAAGVVLSLGWMIYQRATIGKLDETYASYRAGALAQRLGLRLVQGDPTFNLFVQQANVQIRRGARDDQAMHVQLCMRGAPYGYALELQYLHRVERESNFAEVNYNTWFECSFSATAKQRFPTFEVTSRKPPLGPIATRMALPSTGTGNPDVDAGYVVFTNEPNMARVLGEVLPGFGVFANAGVHLVGDGERVSFHMRLKEAPLLPNVLHYAEQLSTLMSDVARRVGG